MDKKPSGFKARWKARYHHASIQLILSIAFTAVAVIGMLFLGMALLLRFSSSANEMAAESSQRVLAQVNWNLDSYLRNMMRVSDTVYYRVIKSADLEQSDTAQELHDALKLLYAKDRDVLVSLAVFDGNGELISATPLTELKNSVTPSREGWFTAAMERIENLHFSTPHVQHLFDDPDARYHWVVSLSRHVELTRGGVIQSGVLLVDMNFSGIEQICKDVSFFDGQGYLYLIDGNGEIIYHPRQQLLYAGLKKEEAGRLACLGDGTYVEDTVIYSVQRVPNSPWRVVGVSYIDETVNESFWQMVRIAVATAALIFAAALAVGWVLSRLLSRPLQQLENAMEQFEQDADHFAFQSVRGTREVQNLSDSFGHMVGRIQRLMNTVREEEIILRKTELKALQAQINPHFLYNTLDSIAWMCERGKNADAVQMVHALARLFRISISRGHELIPIEKELQHAEAYLQIQKYRYKNQFTYHFTVDEDCVHCLCNKITLQPIIENAIVHGLDLMVDDGHIEITVRPDGDDILLIVSDDGIGMAPEQVAALLQNEPSDRTGIGIKNVNDRLRIYFGPGYGLSIDSVPDEGTTVTIRMPQVPADREGDYDKTR